MGEKYEASRDGATLHNNSGRGQYSKGDARWYGNVIDYKDAKKSFGLTKAVWSKICTDAYKVDKHAQPLLKVTLGDEDEAKVRLFVVDEHWMHELMETYWSHNEYCGE